MKTKKFLLSNTTNSKLPDDQLSRIFVGNLNTNQISKKHVLKLFAKFGQIKAISMHKGYAFIQFFHKENAENAIKKMHGQLISGQLVDVNLVTHPKPHQKKVTSKFESQLDRLLESSSRKSSKEELLSENSSSHQIASSIDKEPYLNSSFNSSLNSIINSSINSSLTTSITTSEITGKSTFTNTSKPPVKQNSKLTYLNTNSLESIMSSIYEQYSRTSNHYLQPNGLSNDSTINKQYPFMSGEYLNCDFMICGACKQIFYKFDLFVQHKQALCLFASSKTCITNV